MWRSSKKPNRWKTVETKKSPKNDLPPLRVNSRWKEPVIKKSHVQQRTPVSSGRAVKKTVLVDKSWEEILQDDTIKSRTNNNVDDDINPRIPDEKLYETLAYLRGDRRQLKSKLREHRFEIISNKRENEEILKKKDDYEARLKTYKLKQYDYETKQKSHGFKGECEERNFIKLKHAKDKIDEEMNTLKKRYITNKKRIKTCKDFIEAYTCDIDKIRKRMDELIVRLPNWDDMPKPIITPVHVLPEIEETKQEVVLKEDKPWWNNVDVIRVGMRNWDKEIDKQIEKYRSEFIPDESESDRDDTSEEEKPVEVVKPKNPYALLEPSEISKKIRSFKKKLRQIKKLEERDNLNKEQLEKINRRSEFEKEIQLLEDVTPS